MNKFYLEIITPEKVFFRGEAESVNIPSIGGACTIMAGHQPMVFATEPGTIRITADGETREAFMSEGFIEDERRAEEARERAEEMVRRNRSAAEYQLNRLALQRAFARLRVKHRGNKE